MSRRTTEEQGRAFIDDVEKLLLRHFPNGTEQDREEILHAMTYMLAAHLTEYCDHVLAEVIGSIIGLRADLFARIAAEEEERKAKREPAKVVALRPKGMH